MNVKKLPFTSGVAAIALSIVSGTLVSCTNVTPNNDTATNTDTTNTKNVTDTSTQTNNSDRNIKLRSVGVTLGDLSNPFFVVMAKGAEKEAKKLVVMMSESL